MSTPTGPPKNRLTMDTAVKAIGLQVLCENDCHKPSGWEVHNVKWAKGGPTDQSQVPQDDDDPALGRAAGAPLPDGLGHGGKKIRSKKRRPTKRRPTKRRPIKRRPTKRRPTKRRPTKRRR